MALTIQALGASMMQTLQQLQAESSFQSGMQSAGTPYSLSLPLDTTVSGLPHSGFSALIRDGLQTVSQAQALSDADQRAFASGAPNAPSLAETMLASQKANIAFQELIGIRNELARGYETLVSMPV